MLKRFKDHNIILSAIIILIIGIGVMTLYSVTVDTATESLFRRQLLFAFTGALLYVGASSSKAKELRYPIIGLLIYALCLIGLILTIFVGTNVRGAQRWIDLGPLSLQFGEFAKIGLIIATASILHWQAEYFEDTTPKKNPRFIDKAKQHLLGSRVLFALMVALPGTVLLMLQPSYGSAGIFLATSLLMAVLDDNDKLRTGGYVLIGGVVLASASILTSPATNTQTRSIAIAALAVVALIGLIGVLAKKLSLVAVLVIAAVALVVGVGWRWGWDNVLLGYHRTRIEAAIGIRDDAELGFQTRQSMIAIGSGQLFGQGFAQGIQSRLRFLPDYHTDFIFAAFAEEFGFIGVSILLLLYLFMFVILIQRAGKVETRFSKLLIEGTIIVLLFQFFINVGMNTGLLPVLGIPLPLMSYGGSTLWTTMVLLGLCQSTELKREGITKIAKIRGWRQPWSEQSLQ